MSQVWARQLAEAPFAGQAPLWPLSTEEMEATVRAKSVAGPPGETDWDALARPGYYMGKG